MKTFKDYLNEGSINKSIFNDSRFKIGDKVICDEKYIVNPVTIVNMVFHKTDNVIYYMLWDENDLGGYFTDYQIWTNSSMSNSYFYYKKGSNNTKKCFWSDANGDNLILFNDYEDQDYEEWVQESMNHNFKKGDLLKCISNYTVSDELPLH